ncbi:GNAT family N-acetyltransferase [Flavobacterium sp. SUN052]|uniref:GNAT family N-acetyltransferase n=1 Tax=Flavobacterium sp. SUN052 TaxID=3002441 RepID=UPI00237E4537|nr:GNAT family N-acetyltransferase [Flavobacterium sp. SUN052]MEC4003469.1 GNAT family N-acetyltransferase [Flavobacterium sp. SUN052]
MKLKELTTIQEMLSQLETIKFLYPNMTIEKYESFLIDMIPKNYKQVALFEDEICIGMTGFWFGTKLWTGKYIEIDNFIVHPEYRKKGIGKILTQFIDEKAKELNCTCIVLDAFTGNFEAHRFYYNQGYVPRGFHFIKTIDENGFS